MASVIYSIASAKCLTSSPCDGVDFPGFSFHLLSEDVRSAAAAVPADARPRERLHPSRGTGANRSLLTLQVSWPDRVNEPSMADTPDHSEPTKKEADQR